MSLSELALELFQTVLLETHIPTVCAHLVQQDSSTTSTI